MTRKVSAHQIRPVHSTVVPLAKLAADFERGRDRGSGSSRGEVQAEATACEFAARDHSRKRKIRARLRRNSCEEARLEAPRMRVAVVSLGAACAGQSVWRLKTTARAVLADSAQENDGAESCIPRKKRHWSEPRVPMRSTSAPGEASWSRQQQVLSRKLNHAGAERDSFRGEPQGTACGRKWVRPGIKP